MCHSRRQKIRTNNLLAHKNEFSIEFTITLRKNAKTNVKSNVFNYFFLAQVESLPLIKALASSRVEELVRSYI